MNIRKPLSSLCLAMGLLAGASMSQAALLGLTPSEPTVDFGGAGIISYDAATGLVTISGVPATLFQTDPFLYGEVMGTGADDEKLVTVQFHVDAAGHLVSVAGGPNLVVKGSVDVDFDGIADYDGILLQADATQFGFQDGGAGDDHFDLRLNNVTGVLAILYGVNDLALHVVSEVSTEFLTPFAGTFGVDFVGPAKGILGSTVALPPAAANFCKLDIDATCAVDGGPNKSKCRIKVSKSPKHWEHEEFSYHGHVSHKSRYGMHGSSVPSWANKYPTTNVKFTYVVTNTGTTPVSNLLLTDSFDTSLSGVPTTLAPGQSVTLTRTEKLSEGIDVTATVMGENGTAMCADNDVVVIKDKLRERQRHDEDDFKDKGKKDHD